MVSRKIILFFIIPLIIIASGVSTWLLLKGKKQSWTVYQNAQPPVQLERVILITVDTLRADHLGAYGYPRPTSPFIDRLAQNGVQFQRAFCSMATTTPSHAAIMTSIYPISLKLIQNGHKLDKSFLTLAEIFSAMKFNTAGFVSTNSHFKEGGLDQGFSTFNEPPEKKKVHRRTAEQTMDTCITWLEKRNPSDKFFLWIHLFDLHRPFNPLPQYRKMLSFSSDREKQGYVRFLKEQHHLDLNYFGSEEKALDTIESYDSELLFIDHQIKRLYEWMNQKGLGNQTLWIITGDHGEGLGNHNRLGHGQHIYNVQVRVPLIFHFTDHIASIRKAEQVVEHIDITPTVLELLGWSVRNGRPFYGTSLLPLLLNNGKAFPHKYAFSQRRDYSGENPTQQVNTVDDTDSYESGDKFCLQDEQYKYIHHTTGEDECYHVQDDPYETENLVKINIPECARMKKDLLERVAQLQKGSTLTPQSVNKKTIKKLRSLGYVQ